MLESAIAFFFFQAEDGIRDVAPSRGLGDVYKRQLQNKLQLYHLLKVAHHQMVRHMANHLQVNRQ